MKYKKIWMMTVTCAAVLCKYKRVEIIAGAVCSDHVHLCVSIPPKLSVPHLADNATGNRAVL